MESTRGQQYMSLADYGNSDIARLRVSNKGDMKFSPRLLNSLTDSIMSIILENWTIEELTGYKPLTTFYTDFSIADKFGVNGIKSTYENAFRSWKNNYKYITELAMVLNWKCWRWYQVNDEFSRLYTDLYYKLDEWIFNNLKGDELDYYIQITD